MIKKDFLNEYLKLYLVTDSELLNGRNFYECIEEAIKGGVTTIQLREKNASGKDFLTKALKLREITKQHNVKFIINDRIDIAMICDADGVHLGQNDINIKHARTLLGNDKIIGISTNNLEEAKIAKKDGADYIGVGAMFLTKTKQDTRPISIELAKKIRREIDIPMVLIGGINLENVYKLREINSDGYAIVSAILKSKDIYLETKKWKNVL